MLTGTMIRPPIAWPSGVRSAVCITFDLDAELKIWVSGTPTPIEKTFTKGVDIYEVQAILTQFVAK